MRIISGAKKGCKLIAPDGWGTRPTSDRVRESIFNMLEHRLNGGVYKKRVADLFAGTGAMGLEALSRGAQEAIFVENNTESLNCLRANIAKVGVEHISRVVPADLSRPLRPEAPFDLIFIDPPYGVGLVEQCLDKILEANWLKANTLLVIELGSREQINLPQPFQIEDERTFGKTRILFVQAL